MEQPVFSCPGAQLRMSDIRFNQGTTGSMLLISSRPSDTGRAVRPSDASRTHSKRKGRKGGRGGGVKRLLGREGEKGEKERKGKSGNEMLPAVKMSARHLGQFHTCSK